MLRSLITQACHDLPASGGYSAFKATLIEFETGIGGPQWKEKLNPYALVVMPANVGKPHTADHRYGQVM